MSNRNYEIVKEDPVISFDSDTKNVFYFFEEDLEINELKEIKSNYVLFLLEDSTTGFITGYFLYDFNGKNSLWYVLGGILILCVGGYLFYRRKNNFSDAYFSLLNKIKAISELIGKTQIASLQKDYVSIKGAYIALSPEEKRNMYPRIESLRDKILFIRFEEGITELKKNPNKNLFLKMEKIYNSLSEKNKKKLGKIFLQIKSDLEIKELGIKEKIEKIENESDAALSETKNSEKKEADETLKENSSKEVFRE